MRFWVRVRMMQPSIHSVFESKPMAGTANFMLLYKVLQGKAHDLIWHSRLSSRRNNGNNGIFVYSMPSLFSPSDISRRLSFLDCSDITTVGYLTVAPQSSVDPAWTGSWSSSCSKESNLCSKTASLSPLDRSCVAHREILPTFSRNAVARGGKAKVAAATAQRTPPAVIIVWLSKFNLNWTGYYLLTSHIYRYWILIFKLRSIHKDISIHIHHQIPNIGNLIFSISAHLHIEPNGDHGDLEALLRRRSGLTTILEKIYAFFRFNRYSVLVFSIHFGTSLLFCRENKQYSEQALLSLWALVAPPLRPRLQVGGLSRPKHRCRKHQNIPNPGIAPTLVLPTKPKPKPYLQF